VRAGAGQAAFHLFAAILRRKAYDLYRIRRARRRILARTDTSITTHATITDAARKCLQAECRRARGTVAMRADTPLMLMPLTSLLWAAACDEFLMPLLYRVEDDARQRRTSAIIMGRRRGVPRYDYRGRRYARLRRCCVAPPRPDAAPPGATSARR